MREVHGVTLLIKASFLWLIGTAHRASRHCKGPECRSGYSGSARVVGQVRDRASLLAVAGPEYARNLTFCFMSFILIGRLGV